MGDLARIAGSFITTWGEDCCLFVYLHSVYAMEGKAGSRGDSRSESPASTRSGNIDKTQVGVRTQSRVESVQECVSPVLSLGGFSLTEGMSEEMRFKLEMRRMELEAEKEERELRRLQLEAEAKERRLKNEEAREARRLEAEVRLLEARKERAEDS